MQVMPIILHNLYAQLAIKLKITSFLETYVNHAI